MIPASYKRREAVLGHDIVIHISHLPHPLVSFAIFLFLLLRYSLLLIFHSTILAPPFGSIACSYTSLIKGSRLDIVSGEVRGDPHSISSPLIKELPEGLTGIQDGLQRTPEAPRIAPTGPSGGLQRLDGWPTEVLKYKTKKNTWKNVSTTNPTSWG